MLWGSQASAGLHYSNPKEQGFGKIHGVLSKGPTDCKALGDRGGCLSHGSLGGSYQELTFTCDPGGCCLGPVLMGRGWG